MAAVWWWRKVRTADISQADRDRFERYGETVVALLLGNQLTESPETKEQQIRAGVLGLKAIVDVNAASAWLTERADLAERREDRLETVEWAVLIFVAVGVAADIVLVLQRLG